MTAETTLTAVQLETLRTLIRRWPDLRALTVRQPWADLIMAGVKDVENRSWPVPSTLPQQGDCPRHGRVVLDYGDDGHIADDGPDTGSGHAPDCRGECRYCPVPVQLDPRYPCGPIEPDGPFPFRLGIHAAAKADEGAGPDTWPAYPVDWRASGHELPEVYALGALLGTVEVVGCHHADDGDDICVRRGPDLASHPIVPCSRWAEPDAYHWTPTDPQPLDTPIPMRGMLGLWRLEFVEMAPQPDSGLS